MPRVPGASRVPAALAALAGYTLFAFAGAYRWTVVPAMLAVGLLAVTTRPRILAGHRRAVDTALLLSLTAVAVQLIPLPAAVRDRFSPAAATLSAALRFDGPAAGLAPLSIDPAATGWALAMALTMAVVFWVARARFEEGGLRRLTRGIAWMGIALAVVVFVQRYTSPHHIYGFWAPITRTANPTPFGPYVNRNDLATWLLLAIPLVLGYAAGRMVLLARGRRWTQALDDLVDPRSVLLGGAVLLMVAVLVASLSRSGAAGMIGALAVVVVFARTRVGRTGSRLLAGACVLLLALALPFTNLAAMAVRYGDHLPADVGGRIAIWQDSWAMARDFFATGVGAGAFERGMLVYQQAPRTLFFNHAHNEYLQILAEGGVLVGLPVAALVLLVFGTALTRLRHDVTAVFWFRLGAIGSLTGVAVQSVWDTGLRMPANAVLFALVAAIAVHKAQKTAGPT